MSKVIKYQLCKVVTLSREKPREDALEMLGGEVQPEYEQYTKEVFTPVTIPWSEKNAEIAKREAHNGEYTVMDDGRVKPKKEQIAELKKQLSATDYKVIKCAECQLIGQGMPYDVAELHAERQTIRDQINALEQEAPAE